jgi:hypothetical protein
VQILRPINNNLNNFNFKLENTNLVTTDTLDEPTIPSTTAAPVGPKPGPPRNVTIEKMAQVRWFHHEFRTHFINNLFSFLKGWVVSWLPPLPLNEKSPPVAYYRVKHKEGDGKWQPSEIISKDTAYLSKFCQIICK